MSVVPVGSESTPLTAVRKLLANCEAFQAWTGSADADEALDKIIYLSLDLNAVVPAVFAEVDFTSSSDYDVVADRYFRQSGAVTLYFRADVNPLYATSRSDAQLDFMNNMGLVIDDMKFLSGNPGFIKTSKISRAMGPIRSSIHEHQNENEEPDNVDDYFEVSYNIEWGP